MELVLLLIALCLWGIKSELSDINSTLEKINDSMYEEEEEEEMPENNIVEFVGEDPEGNGLYRIR